MTKIDFGKKIRKSFEFLGTKNREKKSLKSQWKLKILKFQKNISNFEVFNFHYFSNIFARFFLVQKKSKIFREHIFEINFRHEKVIFFVQIFFSWQGMNGFFRSRTSIRLYFASVRIIPETCAKTLWFWSYRDLFASGFICRCRILGEAPNL